MKTSIFLTLLMIVFTRDYKHSTLKVGAMDNLEELYINENLIKLSSDDLNDKSVVKKIDLVLFPKDEIQLVISRGKPIKEHKNSQGENDKHLINFELFGKKGGFLLQKKKNEFGFFTNPFKMKKNENVQQQKQKEEEESNDNEGGLAVTLEYSDQSGNIATFVSGNDWECNGKNADLKKKVSESNINDWENDLDKDAYVIWANGNPKSVVCSFVIPEL